MADSNQFDALEKVGSEIPDELPRSEPQPPQPPVVSTNTPVKPPTTYVAKDHPDGEDDNEQKWKQLATVGAIAAAGIAIILGVRHFNGGDHEDEVETARQKAQRKAKEAKEAAEEAAETVYDRLGSTAEHIEQNAGSALGKSKEAAGSAVGKGKEATSGAYSRASHVASKVEDKAERAADLMKEEIEEEVEEADAAAASPEQELEARRMAFGQDKHGVPKGPAEDDGFLGLKKVFNNLPWNKK